LEKDGSENLIFRGNRVGGGGRSEAETFGNGCWQEGRIRFLGVDGGSDRKGEGGDFEGLVEERKLVAGLVAPNYFFHLRVMSRDELRGQDVKVFARIDGSVGGGRGAEIRAEGRRGNLG
jgi:hypothetical protein